MGLEPLLAALLLGPLAVFAALRWNGRRPDAWRTDPPVSRRGGEPRLAPNERHPGERHPGDP
jgi:hypothetical protein